MASFGLLWLVGAALVAGLVFGFARRRWRLPLLLNLPGAAMAGAAVFLAACWLAPGLLGIGRVVVWSDAAAYVGLAGGWYVGAVATYRAWLAKHPEDDK